MLDSPQTTSKKVHTSVDNILSPVLLAWQIDDEYQWNAASRKAVQHSVVFAAVFGAYLLEQDREQLMKPTSPPLLSELAPQAGKILEARLPFKKDDFRKVLLAVLVSWTSDQFPAFPHCERAF